MWTNVLASIIQKINLSLDTTITDIETKTTEIAAMDTSHLKYGTNTPIFPKLEFLATDEIAMGTSITSLTFSFPADDEIMLFATSGTTHYSRTAGLDFEFGTATAITQFPAHNLEKIAGSYYGFNYVAGGNTFSAYSGDFATVTPGAFASTVGNKLYQNTFESSKLVAYTGGQKKIFSVDGSLDSSTDMIPTDKEYQRGIELGLECYANRFIKTARYGGDIYFLNDYLIPFNAIFRVIAGYVYFTYAYKKAFSANVIAGLGRWELL